MTKSRIHIGIDPGTTGAVAFIWPDGGVSVYDFADRTALMALQAANQKMNNPKAFVEKVASMPGQGVSTTFKFGKSTGQVVGWLEALGIPFEEITPTKWQRLVFDSGSKPKDRKVASLEMARKLFPGAINSLKRKKDHNRADALLIAEACRKAG